MSDERPDNRDVTEITILTVPGVERWSMGLKSTRDVLLRIVQDRIKKGQVSFQR